MEARKELWDMLIQLSTAKDQEMNIKWYSKFSKKEKDPMPKKQGIVSYFCGGQQSGHEELNIIIQILPCDDTLVNNVISNR